jgi:hypothetical protein
LTTCTFGGTACPNTPQGAAQSCVYFNERYDANGNPTQDIFSGTVCFGTGATAAGVACTYIDECVNGYECDEFSAGGSKICRQLCKLGTTACTSGTCKNAFKLTSFVNGSIGLCF